MRKILHAIRKAVKKGPSAPVRRVRVIVDAPPDKLFYVNGGPACKNVKELLVAMRQMSDEQYHFHTIPRGNDFVNWVGGVLGQARLAAALGKAKDRAAAIRALE